MKATPLAVTIASLLVAGACTLGPDSRRPATVADGVAAYVHAPPESPEEPAAAGDDRWWERFGDEVTSELVDLALAENTDLRAAAARVLEAQAALGKAAGSRFPEVTAGLSATRSKTSFVLPEVGRIGIFSTTYSDDLTVSYQVDLFGRLARTREAAWADLLAQEASREALRHTVVSQVVRSRVQIATLERGLAIARGIRESWEVTLRTVERRYRAGLVQAVDLRLARENLAATQTPEVDLEGQLWQARHALDVLVGRRPGSGPRLPSTLPELPDLEPVPLGLPADLVERRPDLRQAEMQLAAATSRIGVALADLFPSLTLTGSGGIRSDTLSELTSSDGLVYSAVGNLLAPLWSGGRRRAEVRAARARAEQAAAAYAGAVLNALREVEDALVRGETARRRLDLALTRVAEARAADRLARERYQRGVEGLLKVLETERRLRSAEEALYSTQADLWTVRIDLFLALGGDWELSS
ncbi:MAG: efflux transporter outer membrane subunit [bacterium]|nr:efflux transporter outer membrane subunit [bacterium]